METIYELLKSQRKRKNGTKILFKKKKMAENLPNPESNLDIQVHEVHKSTNSV